MVGGWCVVGGGWRLWGCRVSGVVRDGEIRNSEVSVVIRKTK